MLKKNSWKPIYISRTVLIEVYKDQINKFLVSQTQPVEFDLRKTFWDRESTIPASLTTMKRILIRTGNGWKSFKINKWNVGFKFGEFTWNRKPWKKRAKRRPQKPKKR